MPRQHVCAWFQRESYFALKGLHPLGEELPATYDAWLDSVTRREAWLVGHGLSMKKVNIDPLEFESWRQRTGIRPDRAGLDAFALEKGRTA